MCVFTGKLSGIAAEGALFSRTRVTRAWHHGELCCSLLIAGVRASGRRDLQGFGLWVLHTLESKTYFFVWLTEKGVGLSGFKKIWISKWKPHKNMLVNCPRSDPRGGVLKHLRPYLYWFITVVLFFPEREQGWEESHKILSLTYRITILCNDTLVARE